MNVEELGAGYFRFGLPEIPDEKEMERVRKIFDATQVADVDSDVNECFVVSSRFWDLYKDCLQNNAQETGPVEKPSICCRGADAEFVQTMLDVFHRTTEQVALAKTTTSAISPRELPTLINAQLREVVPHERLTAEVRYQEAQNKDIGRRLVGEGRFAR